jgi:hypothetical protein
MVTKQRSERRRLRTPQPGPRGWLIAGILALPMWAHLVTPTKTQAQQSLSEYQAKAVCLFNFLKFVEWPADAFAGPHAPIVIGIAGSNPFGSSLALVILGKTVQGRELVIRQYHEGEDLRSCHILFVSASEKKRVPQILSSLRGSSVLTVADMDEFVDAGGMIRFSLEGTQVRFTVDVNAAAEARLKISSKLLSVARVAKGNGKEGRS